MITQEGSMMIESKYQSKRATFREGFAVERICEIEGDIWPRYTAAHPGGCYAVGDLSIYSTRIAENKS
ncbi:hypothetical protein ACJX0J_040433, partial [Zea mays]